MGHELISTWLDLPAEPWPPDHYTLLGLPPGEADPARVERHVQERLERVRQFQLAHPEQATEAMNRLAQAFVCLTDPRAKQAYDAARLAGAAAPAGNGAGASAPKQPDWTTTPPPQRVPAGRAETPAPPAAEAPTLREAATVEAAAAPAAEPGPEAAPAKGGAGRPAQRGLATRRAVLGRVLLVRRLLAAWRDAGRYLSRSTRPLTRPAEATDLLQIMERVRKLLGVLPGLLGEAGQP